MSLLDAQPGSPNLDSGAPQEGHLVVTIDCKTMCSNHSSNPSIPPSKIVTPNLRRDTLPLIGRVGLWKMFETCLLYKCIRLERCDYNDPHKHASKLHGFPFTSRTNTVGHFVESKFDHNTLYNKQFQMLFKDQLARSKDPIPGPFNMRNYVLKNSFMKLGPDLLLLMRDKTRNNTNCKTKSR